MSRAGAVAAALEAIGSPRGGTTQARLVIDATRGNQLAWEVIHYDSSPFSDWLVTVSAATGDVIGKEDRLLHATGQAKLFVPNAVVENDGYNNIDDRDDRDSNRLTNLRSSVTLDLIMDGQSCLKGTWARVRLGDEEKKVCKDSLSWNGITRSKNKFEALMAYHHVTGIQEHIQSLEITTANAERQDLFADVTMPSDLGQDNSFYAPGADQIRFGRGGVDDAEDADVIVHEYGHAVQDAQAPGSFNGNQGGAMGEGFGDYLAGGVLDRGGRLRLRVDALHHGVGRDGVRRQRSSRASASGGPTTSTKPALSSMDYCSQFGPRPNVIHCIGQVWSSALLELRAVLGRRRQTATRSSTRSCLPRTT